MGGMEVSWLKSFLNWYAFTGSSSVKNMLCGDFLLLLVMQLCSGVESSTLMPLLPLHMPYTQRQQIRFSETDMLLKAQSMPCENAEQLGADLSEGCDSRQEAATSHRAASWAAGREACRFRAGSRLPCNIATQT